MKKLLFGCLILLSACQPATATQPPEPSFFPTSTLPPTPVPATSTPEPTPTLEPSPTPLPRFFTNGFDSSLAGWVILQAGNDAVPNINHEDGRLIMQMDSPYTWVYALYGPEDYADVRIDAQFENRAGSPSAIGLVCRYSEVDGWLEYNISADGTYNVLYGRWLSAGIAEYLPVIGGSSQEIGPSGSVQQIGMTCSGNTLQLFINETLVRSVDVTRYDLAGGKIGLTASSFENTPVIAAFDWVTVGEP